MTYSSALAILPKFMWKPILDYLSIKQLTKLSRFRAYDSVFTDIYCKKLMLSGKTGAITVVLTDHIRTSNFWIHACNTHNTYDYLKDLYRSLKKIKKNIYVTVFIKSGMYFMSHRDTSQFIFYNMNRSLSIIGSKSGRTEFGSIDKYKHIYLPYCSSLKNIVFTTHLTIESRINNKLGQKKYNVESVNLTNCRFNSFSLCPTRYVTVVDCKFSDDITLSHLRCLTISNCEFNNMIFLSQIRHLTVSNCEFNNNIISLYQNHQSIITKCIFNSGSYIELSGKKSGSIDFGNNTVTHTQFIFTIREIENNTINIHDNIISNLEACISFSRDTYKRGNTCFLIYNNHLTNIYHKYNNISYAHVKINNSRQVIKEIHNKCKITMDSSNTLTNCGFTVDANTKN